MIKLRDLQYLDAVAKHKHFGHAAESCYVSQPTLSGQIMKLEDQLGLQLIERHRRSVMLTPAGEKLVAEARKVLLAATAFEDSANALKDPLSGDMHIGLIPTLAPYLLPHIMQKLTSTLPRINFYLYELKTDDLLDRLEYGKLDFLILPWLKGMERFERYDLFDEQLLLATHISHTLGKNKKVSLSDLEGYHVLTLEDGHCLRDQAMDYCFSAGADEDERFRATSLETLRYMVASDIGITLLPKLATLGQSAGSAINYVPFRTPLPTRSVALLIRPNYTRLEAVREIVSVVRNAMKTILK